MDSAWAPLVGVAPNIYVRALKSLHEETPHPSRTEEAEARKTDPEMLEPRAGEEEEEEVAAVLEKLRFWNACGEDAAKRKHKKTRPELRHQVGPKDELLNCMYHCLASSGTPEPGVPPYPCRGRVEKKEVKVRVDGKTFEGYQLHIFWRSPTVGGGRGAVQDKGWKLTRNVSVHAPELAERLQRLPESELFEGPAKGIKNTDTARWLRFAKLKGTDDISMKISGWCEEWGCIAQYREDNSTGAMKANIELVQPFGAQWRELPLGRIQETLIEPWSCVLNIHVCAEYSDRVENILHEDFENELDAVYAEAKAFAKKNLNEAGSGFPWTFETVKRMDPITFEHPVSIPVFPAEVVTNSPTPFHGLQRLAPNVQIGGKKDSAQHVDNADAAFNRAAEVVGYHTHGNEAPKSLVLISARKYNHVIPEYTVETDGDLSKLNEDNAVVICRGLSNNRVGFLPVQRWGDLLQKIHVEASQGSPSWVLKSGNRQAEFYRNDFQKKLSFFNKVRDVFNGSTIVGRVYTKLPDQDAIIQLAAAVGEKNPVVVTFTEDNTGAWTLAAEVSKPREDETAAETHPPAGESGHHAPSAGNCDSPGCRSPAQPHATDARVESKKSLDRPAATQPTQALGAKSHGEPSASDSQPLESRGKPAAESDHVVDAHGESSTAQSSAEPSAINSKPLGDPILAASGAASDDKPRARKGELPALRSAQPPAADWQDHPRGHAGFVCRYKEYALGVIVRAESAAAYLKQLCVPIVDASSGGGGGGGPSEARRRNEEDFAATVGEVRGVCAGSLSLSAQAASGLTLGEALGAFPVDDLRSLCLVKVLPCKDGGKDGGHKYRVSMTHAKGHAVPRSPVVCWCLWDEHDEPNGGKPTDKKSVLYTAVGYASTADLAKKCTNTTATPGPGWSRVEGHASDKVAAFVHFRLYCDAARELRSTGKFVVAGAPEQPGPALPQRFASLAEAFGLFEPGTELVLLSYHGDGPVDAAAAQFAPAGVAGRACVLGLCGEGDTSVLFALPTWSAAAWEEYEHRGKWSRVDGEPLVDEYWQAKAAAVLSAKFRYRMTRYGNLAGPGEDRQLLMVECGDDGSKTVVVRTKLGDREISESIDCLRTEADPQEQMAQTKHREHLYTGNYSCIILLRSVNSK
eukprot:gene15170-23170_t